MFNDVLQTVAVHVAHDFDLLGGRCIRMWIDVLRTLAVDFQVFLSDEVAFMSRSQDCADVADAT